jgi:exosortase
VESGPKPAERWKTLAPLIAAGLAFLVLYQEALTTLLRDWWNDPDAAHGLLLAPIALFLIWRRGRAPGARAQPALGLALLFGAVLLRYLSGLAAELFTLRMSMLGAAGALVVFALGFRQILHWWLPVLLLILSVPIPEVLLGSLALPLQLKASQMGAALLESRHVPVHLAGNVIHLPGRALFVTEACSGLRSLTALIALGLLMGGLWLRSSWARGALLLLAIPVAMLLNGLRIFLTGFLAYFVDPRLSEGFMHYTEGWVIFAIAFFILGGIAWALGRLETVRLQSLQPTRVTP